jgi:endo-1,4-beta-xylanase
MERPRRRTERRRAVGVVLVVSLLAACGTEPGQDEPETLRAAAPDGFRIGTAVAGGGHHETQPVPDPFTTDEAYREVLAADFDSVTPENHLKWEMVHPERGRYDFERADEIIAFAEEHDQVVRGHTLVWHSQNPAWLEAGDFSADELREILRDHIQTVVGRYRGRIEQWDVANEVFDDDATWRDSVWYDALGPSFVADALRWAHEADPDAQLFLNDYNVEGLNAKSTAWYELIEELLADDVPVHGFGLQGHLSLEYGSPAHVQANLERFAALGLRTAFTEVDVRMALPDDGTPTDEQLERQAAAFGELLEVCLAVEGCDSFTVWGFTDRYSWVPVFFPGEGAANIRDDVLQPKPAYDELLRLLAEASDG